MVSKMIFFVVFDFDGIFVISKQFLLEFMGEVLVDLFVVVYVVVIFGGDWFQFQKQVVSCLLVCVDLFKFWFMLIMGMKFYQYKDCEWWVIYVEFFVDDQKKEIFEVFDVVFEVMGFKFEKIWGERIEDCGSQIIFFVFG